MNHLICTQSITIKYSTLNRLLLNTLFTNLSHIAVTHTQHIGLLYIFIHLLKHQFDYLPNSEKLISAAFCLFIFFTLTVTTLITLLFILMAF